MRRATRVFALGFALSGCGGGSDTCTSLEDGGWTFDGAAIGMTMGGTVEMDVTNCLFAISEWSMEMSDLPSGGEVEGDTVTLSGDAPYWASCTGKVNTDGTEVSGNCDDGAAFTMSAGAP
jgi:hypothetical protein